MTGKLLSNNDVAIVLENSDYTTLAAALTMTLAELVPGSDGWLEVQRCGRELSTIATGGPERFDEGHRRLMLQRMMDQKKVGNG